MSDIVERLREPKEIFYGGANNKPTKAHPLLLEAADEITSLRAQLEAAKQELDDQIARKLRLKNELVEKLEAANAKVAEMEKNYAFNGKDPRDFVPALISLTAKLFPGSGGMFWELAVERMPEAVQALIEQIADLTARLEGGGEPIGLFDVYDCKDGTKSYVQIKSAFADGSETALYASPPTTSAAVSAALMKAAEVSKWNKTIRDSVESLLEQAGYKEDSSARNQLSCMNFDALSHDTTALREVCLKVADKAHIQGFRRAQSKKYIFNDAIVDEIIGGVK